MSKEAAKKVIAINVSAFVQSWGISASLKCEMLEYFLKKHYNGYCDKKSSFEDSLSKLQTWYDNPTIIGFDCKDIDILELRSMVTEAIRENVRKLSAPKSIFPGLTNGSSLTIERVNGSNSTSTPLYNFNITIVSQTNPGAVCLLSKLHTGQYLPKTQPIKDSVNKLYFTVNDQIIAITFIAYEIGERESLKPYSHDAIIITADISDRSSVNNISHHIVNSRHYSPDNSHFLIGVKWQVSDKIEISPDDMKQIAKENNLRLLKTICLSSEKNTDDILKIIIEQLMQNKAPLAAEAKRKQEEEKRDGEIQNAEAGNGGLCLVM